LTAEQIYKLKEIFTELLLLDPSERKKFLLNDCIESESLRANLQSLIEEHEKYENVLEHPAWESLVWQYKENVLTPESCDNCNFLPHERLGEFRLLQKIGGGGTSDVYLAIQESLNRFVALKVFRNDRSKSFEYSMRFKREAENVSRLSHSNIITIYGIGFDKGVHYIAMEMISGECLDEIIRKAASKEKRLSIKKVLDWIKNIALALDYSHQHGIIHRDIKPSNIHIDPGGRAIIIDFGVAHFNKLPTITLNGSFCGTIQYASPEQISFDKHKFDERADVYSLGVTLYEAVTHRLPFEGNCVEQIFKQIVDKKPLSPRVLNPDVSKDLDFVILKAMEKSPNNRYQSMKELAADLDCLITERKVLTKPISLTTRLLEKLRQSISSIT